jgi:hypothetical protein
VVERHTVQRLQLLLGQLGKAASLARQTGQLAVNASLSAARCGEAGKGFATVSAELLVLNQQAEKDLLGLVVMLERVQRRLLTERGCGESGRTPQWPNGANLIAQGMTLRETLLAAEGELELLEQRYRIESSLDVRAMQLGEAVLRLAADVRKLFDDLLAALQSLLTHLNLVALGDAPQLQQILENSIRLVCGWETDKKLNEFVT